MKISMFLLLVTFAIGSCCKCDIPPSWHGFRFVNSAGEDLVYGPNSIYKKDSIRFYYTVKIDSIRTDTIEHLSRAVDVPGDKPDSVLGVSFKTDGKDTSFVDFGNGDIDTLIVKYKSVDTDCCDYLETTPTLYNNKPLVISDWIIVTK